MGTNKFNYKIAPPITNVDLFVSHELRIKFNLHAGNLTINIKQFIINNNINFANGDKYDKQNFQH